MSNTNQVNGISITNEVIHGDSSQILKALSDNCIDLTVTSPPYDNLKDYKGYTFDFESIAKQLFRVTKKGGVVVWIVADSKINGSESGSSFKQALYFKEIGFNLHDTMIWSKNSFAVPFPNMYHQTFEYMFIFSKGKPKTFNPIMDRKNKYEKTGGNYRREKDGTRTSLGSSKPQNEYGKRFNIWNFNIGGNHVTKDKIAYNHPAIFPEDLAKDHIISWSNKGDIVLDPFAGSGTTLKMAQLLNRNYLGIEISYDYWKLIKIRLKESSNQSLEVFNN